MDDFLKKRQTRYDRWINEKKISFSAKVIPVSNSINARKWILPTEQVLSILKTVRLFALTDCVCRSHYKRCNNPLDVCFLLNEYAERSLKNNEARHISLESAEEVIIKANSHGLVHLSLYQPDHELYALCNCCSCCCHDLQLLKIFNRDDLVIRSEYIALTDTGKCSHCGLCIDVCSFKARIQNSSQTDFDPARCYGCGLCVGICPEDAIEMKTRSGAS